MQKYNPKRNVVSWKGQVGGRDFAVRFVNFMDGDSIQAKYDEDRVTKHTGDQGEVTFTINANDGASFTITLTQGSPTNDQLSLLMPSAKHNRLPVGVFTIEDLNGTTKVKAPETVLKTVAEIKYGGKVTGRAWTFDTGEADIFVGSGGDF